MRSLLRPGALKSGKERVTSQGSARGRFQRALEIRSLMQAEAAARELPRLSLPRG
jgi:hypothetical protein